jgi:hypothetical protein
MSDYIFDGCESEELEQAVLNNKALPLIRELAFKYKLKVLKTVRSGSTTDGGINFVMTKSEGTVAGFPICEVSHTTERNYILGEEVNVDYFNYYSPYFEKSRGRTERDRRTIKSKKLVSLVSTLKRMDAIPEDIDIQNLQVDSMRDGFRRVGASLGRVSRETVLEMGHIQALVKNVINGSPVTTDVFEICKRQLDIFNTADKLESDNHNELKRMFSTEFYAIGANRNGDMMIGTLRLEMDFKRYSPERDEFKLVKPFRRIKSIEDVPEIIPIMTMLKVVSEGSDRDKLCGIPTDAKFYPELDLVVDYYRYPDLYNFVWAMTPC